MIEHLLNYILHTEEDKNKRLKAIEAAEHPEDKAIANKFRDEFTQEYEQFKNMNNI